MNYFLECFVHCFAWFTAALASALFQACLCKSNVKFSHLFILQSKEEGQMFLLIDLNQKCYSKILDLRGGETWKHNNLIKVPSLQGEMCRGFTNVSEMPKEWILLKQPRANMSSRRLIWKCHLQNKLLASDINLRSLLKCLFSLETAFLW